MRAYMQDGAVTLLEAEMRDWPYAAADAQQDATKYLARAVPDLQARLQRIRNCRGAGDEEGLRRERAEFPYATEELDAAAAAQLPWSPSPLGSRAAPRELDDGSSSGGEPVD